MTCAHCAYVITEFDENCPRCAKGASTQVRKIEKEEDDFEDSRPRPAPRRTPGQIATPAWSDGSEQKAPAKRFCSHCGCRVKIGATRCNSCHNTLRATANLPSTRKRKDIETDKSRFCSSCGQAMSAFETYCIHCKEKNLSPAARWDDAFAWEQLIPTFAKVSTTLAIVGLLIWKAPSLPMFQPPPPPAPTPTPTPTPTPAPFISIGPSLSEAIVNMDISGKTEAQRQDYWSKISGTQVTWSGTLLEAGGGRLILSSGSYSSSMNGFEVRLSSSASTNLATLNKGQTVTVLGILSGYDKSSPNKSSSNRGKFQVTDARIL